MGSHEEQRPAVGELAKDTAKDRIGIVMGRIGGRVQIRPLQGGVEWDAMPDAVEAPSPREELSARLAVRNEMTRQAR